MVLYGEDNKLEILREQYKESEIESIDFTGHGFFAYFKINDKCRKLERDTEINDVIGFLNEEKIVVGFILFIREGKIQMLEGFSYDDNWPEIIYKYEFKYYWNEKMERKDTSRNYDALKW